jgi:predicted alpha/beta superfamily hydrolase
MIAGSSMGGLMALYAAVAYNGTFSRAAALSPSLWVVGNRLPELLKAHPLAEPTRIYMDCGSAEAEPRWRNRMLGSMFAAAKTLTTAGASVAARTVPDAKHSEAYWETRIPVFFEYLCGDEFFAQVPEAGQGKGGN